MIFGDILGDAARRPAKPSGALSLAGTGAAQYPKDVRRRFLADLTPARTLRFLSLGLTAVVHLACTSEVPNYTPDADTGSRHAVISVERIETADTDGAVSADAFAQFVRVPAQAEPAKVLATTGIVRTLPAVDTCASSEDFEEFSGPMTTLGPVEFLEVGNVSITANGATTVLAPHAFPTVSDFASGVVYATRDLSAEPLPAAVPYAIRTDGSAVVSALRVQGDAPSTLDQITVNGVPIFEVDELSVKKPLDLTWAVGESTDLVYAELTMMDGGPNLLCAFRDDAGAGTIPADTFAATGSGSIAVHRARAQTFDQTSFDTADLYFDFQQSATVEFTN